MIGYETQLNELRQRLAKNGVYTFPIDVPITAGNYELLEEVAAVMAENLDDYCTCEPKIPASLGEQCRACRHKELVNRLRRIFEPIHRTINPDRLGNIAEAIYFRRWVAQQERIPWLNSGRGTLENVLTPTRVERNGWNRFTGDPAYVPPISQRDAEVAATLMQWLGTSCGRGFVWECEREIAEATGERRQFERLQNLKACGRWNGGRLNDVTPALQNLAEYIANQICPPDKPQFAPLARLIVAGVQTWLQGLQRELAVVPCGDGWEPVEPLGYA